MSEKALPVARSITSPTTVFNFHFDWLRHFQGFPLNCFYLNKICEGKKYFGLSSIFHIVSMIYLNLVYFRATQVPFIDHFTLQTAISFKNSSKNLEKIRQNSDQRKLKALFIMKNSTTICSSDKIQTKEIDWYLRSYCCIFSSLFFDWKFCL